MTDEHEHAMKVWREADRAGEDAYVEAVETGTTAVEAHEAGNQAAAAVIAADRAGLVARIAELEGALFDATAMIGHNLTMKATALVAGKTLNAYDVWKAGNAALKDTRND